MRKKAQQYGDPRVPAGEQRGRARKKKKDENEKNTNKKMHDVTMLGCRDGMGLFWLKL